jgi:hypothetical protein
LLRKGFYSILFLVLILIVVLTGCRGYDGKPDVAYFLKTEPEKAILDFFYSLNNKDPDYIYTNLLPDSDKNNISREKYVAEFEKILSDVDSIEVKEIVYLGYENNMSKVVAEFEVSYKNGEVKQYKKYVYLTEEKNKWKILFEKTFI